MRAHRQERMYRGKCRCDDDIETKQRQDDDSKGNPSFEWEPTNCTAKHSVTVAQDGFVALVS